MGTTSRQVDLVLADGRLPLNPASGRSWSISLDHAGAGLRYAYSSDGGPRRPDPRSVSIGLRGYEP